MKNTTRIIPPNVVALISGVIAADVYDSGYARLHYCDGKMEGANLSAAQLAQGRDNFLSLVSVVQSYRPNTLKYP